MRLDRLLQDVALTGAVGDLVTVEVTDVALDHRAVGAGALFCCLPGRRTDGHRYAAEAVRAGAVAVLAEHPVEVAVPQALVAPGAVRPAMADAACRLWDRPSHRVTAVGVTGTNGKTSVTHLLADVLRADGRPTVVIGTLSGDRTTPEAPELQRRLARAVDDGATAAAVEVSSHALIQHRVRGTRFAAGVFTNLAQDHLDFHGTMDAYFEAKALLFEREECHLAVVNRDDRWGRRLVARLSAAGRRVVTYGADEAGNVVSDGRGSTFTWRGRRIELGVPGAFQVHNALAAAATAEALGVAEATVAAGLQAASPVPGRFEVVAAPPVSATTVIVDFAHTPDALRAALASSRRLAAGGRVLVVFGCGGDRDQDKRALMGRVAADGADVVVVTSDNSRSEDPAAIAEAVLAGTRGAQRRPLPDVVVELDRRAAIEVALRRARRDDVVLVAGKGHETTLDSGGAVVPFDDRQVAAELVARPATPGGSR